MTVPSYTTDLQTVNLNETNANWSELSGRSAGGADATETTYYIQGAACVSQSTGGATGRTMGLEYDHGSDLSGSMAAGFCYFVWQTFLAPTAIDTWANMGMMFGVGSASGDINFWKTMGNDYARNPYGGWQNTAIDPTFAPDSYDGSPGAAHQIFGSSPNMLVAVSKGNPHGIDAIRYGRGELKIEHGEAANYGTFAGLAAKNDNNEVTNGFNRWGLFQEQAGIYLWKGLMSFGNVTNPCDFRDSNRNISVDDTPRTYAAFNKIEINNASSRVDWTGVNLTAIIPGGLSVGSLEMIANATVNFTTCVFTDMNTFIFMSNAVLAYNTWRRCALVTQGGADIDNCTFDEATGAVALKVSNLNNIDNCDFASDGTGHAMELDTSHAGNAYTLTGCTYSGYASSDGSTGNEVIYNNSGGAVTITISGGDTPTIMNGSGASTTIVSGAVTVYVKAVTATGAAIQTARVLLRAKDGTGPFPYDDTVTIVNSGTTATVTHNAHNMLTTDKVQISGASLAANNGVFSIIKLTADTYTYTMGSTPGSSPTGTIKANFVALSGLTDVNGEIETSRVYPSDQPVVGWARKGTSTPFYKSAPLVGDVDNAVGFTGTGVLIIDE